MNSFVGRVFEKTQDGSIGDPLEGVKLDFNGPTKQSISTTGDGTYKAKLPTGRYTVKLDKKGFETDEVTTILDPQSKTLNLILEAKRKGLATKTGIVGRVFERNPDGTIGQIIEGASIAMARLRLSSKALSNDQGIYNLEVPQGKYTYSVRKEGYQNTTGTVVVANKGKHTLNIFLNKTNQKDYPIDICVHAPNRRGETRTSKVILPGHSEPVELTYEVYDGLAVLEGGIVLGKVKELDHELRELEKAISSKKTDRSDSAYGTIQQGLVALKSQSKLWEGGVLPFAFGNINSLLRNRIDQAMEHITNNTNIEFVPSGSADRDYVTFLLSQDPDASSAQLGRQGGEQFIWLNQSFDVGGIVHEILHALGVLHEQSRNDRDTYVQVNDGSNGTSNNICSGRHHNFRKRDNLARDIGPYDYESVMHYGANSFTRTNGEACNPSGGPSIEPTDPSISSSSLGKYRRRPPFLSPLDIKGLNELYPVRTAFDGGHLWGSGNFSTDLAFGDFRGNGADELVVTRKARSNGRYYILGDATNPANPFPKLYTGGEDWGSGNYATCCATGDVDGDGKDEIIIGRKAGSGMRFEVIKLNGANTVTKLFEGGNDWGSSAYTTDVAIKVDRFGTSLIGVSRKHGTNSRFYVFSGAAGSFELLFEGGDNWGDSNYATGIDFGDVDGDGYLELGITRKAGTHGRFYIYKAVNGDYRNFRQMHSGGTDWGSGEYATAIAFGDVDGDGRDEIGVARKATNNGRFFIYDSAERQFRKIHSGGQNWGSSYYANSIAMADIDGDGRAEVAVTRKAGENGRYFLFDDANEHFSPLMEGGRNWGDSYHATAIALGNARGTGRKRHVGVARQADSNARFMIQEYNG